MKADKTILLFAKEKPGFDQALEYLESNFGDVRFFKGSVDDSFPEKAKGITADICVSYLSPWIIPEHVLNKTKEFSINFHPGPPEYPGIGCTNFAIYNGEKEFGVTVHHMVPMVDSGELIKVMRFPIEESDTVYSLTQRSYKFILSSFIEVFDYHKRNNCLPECNEKWKRKPYTRKELNELCRITLNMSKEEVVRRVKATTYPNMPGAFIEVGGIKFVPETSPGCAES